MRRMRYLAIIYTQMTYDQAETLYKNINNSNYSDALNKTKLSFINGDYGKGYMHPF